MVKRTSWRAPAALAVLLATVGAFAYYFSTHAEVRQQLANLPKGTLAVLLCLYFLAIGALAMINTATLRLCRSRIKAGDSVLLSAYSTVINFFGPLQSGPAFRAAYINRKYGVKLKNYTLATFVYYFFYALISGLFLLSGWLGWWLLPLSAIGVVAGWQIQKSGFGARHGMAGLDMSHWLFMAVATFIQIGLVLLIYWTELRAVAPGTDFGQAVVYTGAANLALFVSFTPGAIGFREAFLVFSQNLHHISNSTIVAANIIDRAVYILLLAILAVFIFGTHASRRFKKTVETES